MLPTSENSLRDLLRAYSALCPIRTLTFPSNLPFAIVHDFVLHSILLSRHMEQYSPSKNYQLQFWKWVINNLEELAGNDDVEVDERFYERQITLLTSTEHLPQDIALPPPPSFITHYWRPSPRRSYQTEVDLPTISLHSADIPDHVTTTLLESRTTIEAGTTGLRTWRASFVLARYLIAHPELVLGNAVLELGSGTGFLGAVITSLQTLLSTHSQKESSSVWLTDVNERVLRRCSENVHLPCNISSNSPNLYVRSLDWSDALDSVLEVPLLAFLREVDPDLILGADIVYHPDIIPALLATLQLALTMPNSVEKSSEPAKARLALLTLTVRNEDTMQAFLRALDEKFFVVEDITSDLRQQTENPFFEQSEGIDQEVRLLKIAHHGSPFPPTL